MQIKKHSLIFLFSLLSLGPIFAAQAQQNLTLTEKQSENIHAIQSSLIKDRLVLQKRFSKIKISQISTSQLTQAKQLLDMADHALSFAALTGDPGYYALADQLDQIVLKTQPNNPRALFLDTKNLRNRHHFSEAKASAEKLIQQRGIWIDWILLGDAQMDLGKLRAAQDAYQKAMDLKPGYMTYTRAGLLKFEQNKLDESLFFFTLAKKSAPRNNPEISSFIDTNLAQIYYYSSQFIKAEKDALSGYQHWPSPGTTLLLAKIYKALNKQSKAIELLQHLSSYYPHPEALTMLVDMGVNKKQNTELLMQLGSAIDARSFAYYLINHTDENYLALKLAKSEFEDRQDVRTRSILTLSLLATQQAESAHLIFSAINVNNSPYPEYHQAKHAINTHLTQHKNPVLKKFKSVSTVTEQATSGSNLSTALGTEPGSEFSAKKIVPSKPTQRG
ncbi:MAG: tetratricopeptide repeat protein [bacterium]